MPKAVQTQCEAEASMPHLRLSVRDDGLVYSETHDVVEDYCVSSEGYLRVMAGCQVLVHFFQGSDDLEKGGWCYGEIADGSGAAEGWFPQRVLGVETMRAQL